MTVTIFVPVSREWTLPKLFVSLELLNCKRETTNLLVLVDGDASLFLQARNLTENSKFDQRLCVHRKDSPVRQFDILGRRKRIAEIHNEAKQYIQKCDYVFLIEDDTIVPANALEKLLKVYSIHPYAGLVSGVELGRWGVPLIGAWTVDDVYEPSKVESVALQEGVNEVDTTGLYCALTKSQNYLSHDFKPLDPLGPDYQWGLSMRQEGLKNYADFSITCEHRTKSDEAITLANTAIMRIVFKKEKNRWNQKITR